MKDRISRVIVHKMEGYDLVEISTNLRDIGVLRVTPGDGVFLANRLFRDARCDCGDATQVATVSTIKNGSLEFLVDML